MHSESNRFDRLIITRRRHASFREILGKSSRRKELQAEQRSGHMLHDILQGGGLDAAREEEKKPN